METESWLSLTVVGTLEYPLQEWMRPLKEYRILLAVGK